MVVCHKCYKFVVGRCKREWTGIEMSPLPRQGTGKCNVSAGSAIFLGELFEDVQVGDTDDLPIEPDGAGTDQIL